MRVRNEALATKIRSRLQDEQADEEMMELHAEQKAEGEAWGFTGQRMVMKFQGRSYPARLVNLPTLVETHKTFGGSTYYKCGDVSQLVVVYESEKERQEDEDRHVEGDSWQTYHPDGLSPPLRDVVTRRFSKARRAAKDAYGVEEVAAVEAMMIEIVSNQGKVSTEEILCEDVVPFQDWMADEHGSEKKTVSDDAPIAAKHPWILVDKIGAHDLANQPISKARPAASSTNSAINVGVPMQQAARYSPVPDSTQKASDSGSIEVSNVQQSANTNTFQEKDLPSDGAAI